MRVHHHTKSRFIATLAVGFALILLGAVFILQNLGLVPPGMALHFWPAALLVLAIGNFGRRGLLSFSGHVLILVAFALQAKYLGHREWLTQWWPLGLIWLGMIKVLRVLWFRWRTHVPPSCQDVCERLS
jgi:hypothetical protein